MHLALAKQELTHYLNGSKIPILLKTSKYPTMKNAAYPSLFFLANPLKAVQAEPAAFVDDNYQTPYLRSILSSKSAPSRVYSLRSIRDIFVNTVRPFISALPDDIEESEKEWFNNYE